MSGRRDAPDRRPGFEGNSPATVVRPQSDPRFPQNYYQRSVVETSWTTDRDGRAAAAAAPKAVDAEPERQVRRAVLLYKPDVFDREILDSFRSNYGRALLDNKLEGVDLTVEVLNKPAYLASLTAIVITASSTCLRHDAALEALFPQLFPQSFGAEPSGAANPLLKSLLLDDPADIRDLGTPMADRHGSFNLHSKEYGGFLYVEAVDAFFYWLKWAVYAASNQENSNLQSHFRLVPEDRQVYANVIVFEVDQEAQRLGLSEDDANLLAPFPPLPPPGLPMLEASAPRGAVPAVSEEGPPAKFRRRDTPSSPLLGLGEIYFVQMGHRDYERARAQYASFGESYPVDQFQPFLISRPKDVAQIVKIVDFAINNKKRVVTRSGGHQYCGFSSGDQNCVQIVMDDMQDRDMEHGMKLSTESADAVRARGCSIVSPDYKGKQWFLSVAPRCRLKDLSETLVKNKLTIPHGECPLVGIGGHVQTGGYGHQMRGLGLCLDYVYSFDIVVCTEHKKDSETASIRKVTVYRPEMNLVDEQVGQGLNDSLYKGVLGGSPGAFGVITRIKFLAVHDDDPAFAKSKNVQKVFPHWGWNVKEGATKIVRKMLKLVSSKEETDELCDGLDVFVTIVSVTILNVELGIVVPELAYTGGSTALSTAESSMEDILDACRSSAIPGSFLLPGQRPAHRPPSAVAHKGVRTDGKGVTSLGREFDHPYKKRVNVMLDTNELSEDDAEHFAHEFGNLASEVVVDSDLLLVIQMNLGGGKVSTNDSGGRTGIPYRNQSFGFVFDVFYTNREAEARATGIQNKMQNLLDRIGGGCFNHRLFWGSFGRENGETDLSQPNVQRLYYGSDKVYRDMQAIKDLVDPNGVFTTEFTVQNTTKAVL